MIEQILLLFIGFIASYALFMHTFKTRLQEKYRLIRFKAKNSILANEALFADKNREIALLNEQISEISRKKYAMQKKSVSEKHFYQADILEEYEMQKRLKNAPPAEDDKSGGNGTSSDAQTKKKEDENILADFPVHLL